MKVDKAYYVGTSPHSFRTGEAAEILGVLSVQPEGKTEYVVCFHVEYEDGKEDYCPVSDISSYEVLTHKKIRRIFIPVE